MSTALLLSGGLDSTSLAYWQRPEVALTINYGQVCYRGELRAASVVCKELAITHDLINLNCSSLGSGDLAGSAALSIAPVSEWWPFRNQLLVTVGATRSLSLGVETLLIGAVASDSSHVDGTREYLNALASVLKMQEGNLKLLAPAIEMSSEELVLQSRIPLSVLAWSHSCHTSDIACGRCRGCAKHRRVIEALGHVPC